MTEVVAATTGRSHDLEKWAEEVLNLFWEKRRQYAKSFEDSAKAFKHPSDSDLDAGTRLFLQREYDKLKRIHSAINKNEEEKWLITEDALKDIVGYVFVLKDILLQKNND